MLGIFHQITACSCGSWSFPMMHELANTAHTSWIFGYEYSSGLLKLTMFLILIVNIWWTEFMKCTVIHLYAVACWNLSWITSTMQLSLACCSTSRTPGGLLNAVSFVMAKLFTSFKFLVQCNNLSLYPSSLCEKYHSSLVIGLWSQSFSQKHLHWD